MLDLFLCSGARDLDLLLAGLLSLDAALPAGTGVLDLGLLLLGRVGVLTLLLVGDLVPLLRDLDLVLPPLLPDGVLDLLLGDLAAVVLLGDLVTAACLAWILDLVLLL
jgi:hypothetical protein